MSVNDQQRSIFVAICRVRRRRSCCLFFCVSLEPSSPLSNQPEHGGALRSLSLSLGLTRTHATQNHKRAVHWTNTDRTVGTGDALDTAADREMEMAVLTMRAHAQTSTLSH